MSVASLDSFSYRTGTDVLAWLVARAPSSGGRANRPATF